MIETRSGLSYVTTRERPDLTAVTGAWRWEAFFSNSDISFEQLMAREQAAAVAPGPLPTVLVLLEGGEPIGMVALCNDDLEDRPELNPWLAGLYVAPAHRGDGHAQRLIARIETVASEAGFRRLSLYSASAVGLYRSRGWMTTEIFDRDGAVYHIMRKYL